MKSPVRSRSYRRPSRRPAVSVVLVLVLVLLLGVAGCGRKGATSDSSSPAPAGTGEPPADEVGDTTGVTDSTIKIGLHAPLTLGSVDVESLLKVRAQAEAYWGAVNDAGGINDRKVELVIVDDGYAADSAVQACRDLLADDVLFVFGVAGADQISACGQYVLGEDVPYLSLGQSEAGLVGKDGYNALTITYDRQAPLQAQYVVNELGGTPDNVGFVRYDSANLKGAHDAFLDEFEKLAGGKPAVDDTVSKTPNASALSAECLKLEQEGVEIVTVLAAPTVTSALANACEATGYTPQYVGWAGTGGCQVDPAVLGTPALDGCRNLTASHQPKESKAPVVEECRAHWEAAEGGELPTQAEQNCAIFDVIREALDETGPDLGRTSFLTTMAGFKYDNGYLNPLDFEDGGQVGSSSVLVTEADAADLVQDEIVSKWSSSF